MEEEITGPKAIAPGRDRLQSLWLVWVAGTLLVLAAAAPLVAALRLGSRLRPLAPPLLFSFGFATLVLVLRAATLPAAVMGFLICFILAQSPQVWTGVETHPLPHTAIHALVALFILTFAATKYGRLKKETRGLAEARHGRAASQIVANLSMGALFAAAGSYEGCIAALAEAAADTVSSEIGQAIGGPAWLITSLRRVPPGTDGGVSLAGTAAGVVAAAIIVQVGASHHSFWPHKASVFIGACAGLFFDSLLGASVERQGWIGNDLVNFASTLFAATLALGLTTIPS
jgi:uncharacterized protein (TIGR00297 family)